MTSQELYYDFHILLNKNNEDRNINIEKGNFVRLFNRESERWLSDYIERNNNSDNIFAITDLLEKDFKLKKKSGSSTEVVYEKPENLFSVIQGDFRSDVKSGSCTSVIYNNMVKPQDVNSKLRDKFYAPSVEWERGLAKITEDSIVVYTKEFTINSSTLSYYRRPRHIDIEGYINLDNKNSKNVNPDVSDYIANQILDRVVLEVQREFASNEFQFAQTRERTN